MALLFTSGSLLPDSFVWMPSRAAVRPSLVPKSAATALINSFAPEFLASSNAHPLDSPSFINPQSPLGSATVTAMPAIITLSKSVVHSFGVKLALFATAALLGGFQEEQRTSSGNSTARGERAGLAPRCDGPR